MSVSTIVAGTMESGDMMVTISPSEEFAVAIESSVQALYGEAIRRTVGEVLAQHGITKGRFYIEDHGARDFVIRARMESAIAKLKQGADKHGH